MSKVHNLDVGVSDSFKFIIRGHEYSFRYLNTEEMNEFIESLNKKDKNLENLIFNYITPVNEGAPVFGELYKKMIVPEIRAFNEMITSEFKG